MRLLQFFVQKEILSDSDVLAIEEEIAGGEESLEKVLIKHGVTEDTILTTRGEYYEIPTRRITVDVPQETLHYVPEESARHYAFVPLGVVDGVLELGIVNPDNLDAFDAINFISQRAGLPYKAFLILESDFEKVLKQYEGISSVVGEALEDLALSSDAIAGVEEQRKAKKATTATSKQATETLQEDAPITKIVATTLEYAVSGKASDIHIEPLADKIRVRFRVDGELHTSLVLPSNVLRAVVARVKILSNMKLDEQRKPQDGRFSATIEKRRIDFRVSTFPTTYGEKVVIRILDTQGGVRSLDNLGLSERNLARIREAIKKPYGLILISGPTGSGKSSTLYSMLSEVERERKNVLSLEDPVEYNLVGMSQSQVFPEIGYTFASGLRTTLRQDPDIIMVGEIRDKETAQLAIQAALTGHLVLSTIHTNSAIGVIPRLIDMGVDPYLIAPTLVLAIAQRLVKVICPNSGEPLSVRGNSLEVMLEKQFEDLPTEFRREIPSADHMLKIKPTSECPNGTRGRMAVIEMFEMSPSVEHIVLNNPTDEAIYTAVRKDGMLTMKEDAIIKALERKIPFEEINALGGELLTDDEELETNNDMMSAQPTNNVPPQ